MAAVVADAHGGDLQRQPGVVGRRGARVGGHQAPARVVRASQQLLQAGARGDQPEPPLGQLRREHRQDLDELVARLRGRARRRRARARTRRAARRAARRRHRAPGAAPPRTSAPPWPARSARRRPRPPPAARRRRVTRPREALDVMGAHARARAARGQRDGDPLVRAEPPGGRRGVVDGAAHERVAEGEPAPVARRADERSRDERVERLRDAARIELGADRGELGVERVARDGRALQQRARRVRQRGHLVLDRGDHARRQLVVGEAGELAQEQRVAARVAGDPLAHGRVGQSAQHRERRVVLQRLEQDVLGARAPARPPPAAGGRGAARARAGAARAAAGAADAGRTRPRRRRPSAGRRGSARPDARGRAARAARAARGGSGSARAARRRPVPARGRARRRGAPRRASARASPAGAGAGWRRGRRGRRRRARTAPRARARPRGPRAPAARRRGRAPRRPPSSAVLPIPSSPTTTSTRESPPRTASTASCTALSWVSRPTSSTSFRQTSAGSDLFPDVGTQWSKIGQAPNCRSRCRRLECREGSLSRSGVPRRRGWECGPRDGPSNSRSRR